MKNKLRFYTRVWLVYRWLTMDYTIEFIGITGMGRMPLRKFYSLSNYLYVWKQKILVDRIGEETFLQMTIAEILETKV